MLNEADKHREDVPVGQQWQPIRVPSSELIQEHCSTAAEVDEFCRGWIEGSAAIPRASRASYSACRIRPAGSFGPDLSPASLWAAPQSRCDAFA